MVLVVEVEVYNIFSDENHFIIEEAHKLTTGEDYRSAWLDRISLVI